MNRDQWTSPSPYVVRRQAERMIATEKRLEPPSKSSGHNPSLISAVVMGIILALIFVAL